MDIFKFVIEELPLPAWFLAAYLAIGLFVKMVRFIDRTNQSNNKIDQVITRLDKLELLASKLKTGLESLRKEFGQLIEVLRDKKVIRHKRNKFKS